MVVVDDIDAFFRKQGLRAELLTEVAAFRRQYNGQGVRQISKPHFPYFGRQIVEAALSALLTGANLLLVGPKAVGKNILAENLTMAIIIRQLIFVHTSFLLMMVAGLKS